MNITEFFQKKSEIQNRWWNCIKKPNFSDAEKDMTWALIELEKALKEIEEQKKQNIITRQRVKDFLDNVQVTAMKWGF